MHPPPRHLAGVTVPEKMGTGEIGGRGEIWIETTLVIGIGHVPSAKRANASERRKRQTVEQVHVEDRQADEIRSFPRPGRRTWSATTMMARVERARGRTRTRTGTKAVGRRGPGRTRTRTKTRSVMAIDEIEIVIEAAGMIPTRRPRRDGLDRDHLRGTRTGRIDIASGIEIGRERGTATANEERTARAAGLDDTPEAAGRTDTGRGRVARTTRKVDPMLVTTTV